MPTLYDNFERVRQYIDQHQVDVDLSSYVSYAYLESKHYLTEHQDLSSYVTKTDLSNAGYISGAEISQMGYITSGDVSAMGYLTAVPSEYVTQDELSANSYLTEHQSLADYPTYAAISAMGYVTSSDLPVIDENIIPKETGTYTLGDSSYMYSTAYVSDLWTSGKNRISNRSDNQINIQLNNGWKYTFHSNGFNPANNNQDLGNSTPWRSTYTAYIYTDTAYLNDTSYTKSIVPAETDSYTLGDADHFYNASYTNGIYFSSTNKLYNQSSSQVNLDFNSGRIVFSKSSLFASTGINLGSSTRPWAATYTANLYADTIHNFIWTGTSAEYAALDNYTSYQIYLIQEA